MDQAPPLFLPVRAHDLVIAMYNTFYNSVGRASREPPLPSRLCFEIFGSPDLIVPASDLWGHQSETVPIVHDGRTINLQVPTPLQIRERINWHRHIGCKFEESRTLLDQFLAHNSSATGQMPLHLLIAGQPTAADWQVFRAALDAYLEVFMQSAPDIQEQGARLAHRYAAAHMFLMSANIEDYRIARQRYATARTLAEEQSRRDIIQTIDEQEEALQKAEATLLRLAEEVALLMQMYWIFHFEAGVMPGLEDEPVWRFLPPVLHRRLRYRRVEREDDPPPPADPIARRRVPLPQPDPAAEEVEAIAGLFEVLPDSPIWNHPRVEPYRRQWASKRIYTTRFLGREDYFAIPLRARSGLVIIALVSLNEGHTADYFFRAGRRGDTPEQLHRWVKHAQWRRKRLRQERPDTYIGNVWHETLPSWKRGVQRILDEN